MKCKSCKVKFVPTIGEKQVTCLNAGCIIEWNKKESEKISKEETKKIKESLKTNSDYFKDALRYFNTYIRARDIDKPCISCLNSPGEYKITSGHFYPQGDYNMLAFNEDNAHAQCWFNCNKNKHGNLHEYRINLIKRIGIKRVDELNRLSREPIRYSNEELVSKKEYYKRKGKLIFKLKTVSI